MDPPQCDIIPDQSRRRGGKRSSTTGNAEVAGGVPPASVAPCGACKFLRRKCVGGCLFAPHFGPDQGSARFAAVHKVFGASNVSKLLMHIPASRRHDAVVTISYEAQARLSDPVYGCVSTIIALQQQVASLQAELSVVQSQLINNRFVLATALQNSQQQQIAATYSNTSMASNNNIVSLHSFNPNNFAETTVPANSFESILHLSGRPMQDEEEEEDEDESHIDPITFASQVFH